VLFFFGKIPKGCDLVGYRFIQVNSVHTFTPYVIVEENCDIVNVYCDIADWKRNTDVISFEKKKGGYHNEKMELLQPAGAKADRLAQAAACSAGTRPVRQFG
jgi:hypothetical protein